MSAAEGPRASAAIAGISAYRVPRHPAPVELILDGNEGIAPPAWLLKGLAKIDPEKLRRYPKSSTLCQQLAIKHGVEPEQIIVTAGGDDCLDRICRAFLGPGRRLIAPAPSFEMIGRYARATGAQVDEPHWAPRSKFPVAAVLELLDEDVGAIALVSPNNPTGGVVSATELQRIAGAAPRAAIIVDLAYVEFADEDLTEVALALANSIVVRTFSKCFGLAGLRVGYAIASPEIIASLKAAGAPYPVSVLSLTLAEARLARDDPQDAAFIDEVRREREELSGELSRLGAEPYPSQGNFVLARFSDAALLRDCLAGLSIGVRLFPGKSLLENMLRITCPGRPEEQGWLLRALGAALDPEALILDMDGVIADVSGSYRASILVTAESYGLTVTQADVAREKAAGDANNDWVLTQRLLKGAGIECSLAEVTERFETIYQGSDEEPGLRRHEKLIGSREVLERLRKKKRLAIVTGRPRADAEKFLALHGLSELFELLICLEDGPSKPDPAPVLAALRGLGLSRAWMVGDTVDDITAARAAGVVPFGIAAPGEELEVARRLLGGAGAARTIASLTELEEWLP